MNVKELFINGICCQLIGSMRNKKATAALRYQKLHNN